MNFSSSARLAYEFEIIVSKILKKCGFHISLTDLGHDIGYDISADYINQKFAIEVKLTRNINIPGKSIVEAVKKLALAASKENRIPFLIIAGLVSGRLRGELENYGNLVVWDIQNLLYLVQNDEALRNSLISILSFSIDELVPIGPEIILKNLPPQSYQGSIENRLIEKLKSWNPEDKKSTQYEELCCEILKALFFDDLSLWEVQQKSNGDLFRFDLICKIKDGNDKEFWKMAERYFQTKYIIFEFKNYTNEITQKEIFTTEKYLYSKALRGVAIIISTKGTDKNADKAIKGILREDGKLIISLSNQDLVKMLAQKENNDIPADYLSEKLDQLLIDLEK